MKRIGRRARLTRKLLTFPTVSKDPNHVNTLNVHGVYALIDVQAYIPHDSSVERILRRYSRCVDYVMRVNVDPNSNEIDFVSSQQGSGNNSNENNNNNDDNNHNSNSNDNSHDTNMDNKKDNNSVTPMTQAVILILILILKMIHGGSQKALYWVTLIFADFRN